MGSKLEGVMKNTCAIGQRINLRAEGLLPPSVIHVRTHGDSWHVV